MADKTVESLGGDDNDVCTNCGQDRGDHTAIDYLCPADSNDGDDDMSFSTMLPRLYQRRPVGGGRWAYDQPAKPAP